MEIDLQKISSLTAFTFPFFLTILKEKEKRGRGGKERGEGGRGEKERGGGRERGEERRGWKRSGRR